MGLRSLPAGLETRVASRYTEPGYLVAIHYPTQIVRMSSRGTLSCQGETWVKQLLEISGLGSNGGGEAKGEIRLGNLDNAMAALFMTEGVKGRRVQVWLFDGDAPADDEIVLVFDGSADAPRLAVDRAQVALVADRASVMTLPRGVISPAHGFTHQTASGTVFSWGTQTIRLEVRRG